MGSLDPRMTSAALQSVRIACKGRTQSGKHVDPIAQVIVEDMVSAGYRKELISENTRGVTLPGWFRPSKKWDITAREDDVLVAALELKTISSSFGKNFNNRAEEAIGSAYDTRFAANNHLMEPNSLPPNLGYFLLVHRTEESARKSSLEINSLYKVDDAFGNASYVDRFAVMGKRLLRENVYGAVCVLEVDTENDKVTEPDSETTYAKFLARLKSWIDIARA